MYMMALANRFIVSAVSGDNDNITVRDFAACFLTSPRLGERAITTLHPLKWLLLLRTKLIRGEGKKGRKKKKKKVALCGQITVANCPMETAGGQGSVSKFSHISPKIDIAEQAPPNEERREKGKTDMPRRSKAVTSWVIASLKRG